MAAKVDFTLDYNVIYNKALSPKSRTDDSVLSLEFTKTLVAKLSGWGFKKGFYGDRDDIPGKNVFKVLIDNVKNSKKTIVIITSGFLKNCWSVYSHQNAFKSLLDKNNSGRLIPIALDVEEHDIPQELNVQTKIFFSKDDYLSPECDAEWNKLKMAFGEAMHDSTGSNTDSKDKGKESHAIKFPGHTIPAPPEPSLSSFYHAEYKETEFTTSSREFNSEQVTLDLSSFKSSSGSASLVPGASMSLPSAPIVKRPTAQAAPQQLYNNGVGSQAQQARNDHRVVFASQDSLMCDGPSDPGQSDQGPADTVHETISSQQSSGLNHAAPKPSTSRLSSNSHNENKDTVTTKSSESRKDSKEISTSEVSTPKMDTKRRTLDMDSRHGLSNTSNQDMASARPRHDDTFAGTQSNGGTKTATGNTNTNNSCTENSTVSMDSPDALELSQRTEASLDLSPASSLNMDSLLLSDSSGYVSNLTSPNGRGEPDGFDELKLGATAKTVDYESKNSNKDNTMSKVSSKSSKCEAVNKSKKATPSRNVSSESEIEERFIAFDGETVARECRSLNEQLHRSAQQPKSMDDGILRQDQGVSDVRRASSASMFAYRPGARRDSGWFNVLTRILSRPDLAFN